MAKYKLLFFRRDSHRKFPIAIGLSLTTLVLFGFIYFLYKKQVFHCKQKSHNVDLGNLYYKQYSTI